MAEEFFVVSKSLSIRVSMKVDEERLIFFQIIIRRVNEYAFYSAAVGEFSVFGANKRIRLPTRIVIVQTIRT